VRRLFSTFASGPPGVGLLLIRLSCGTYLVLSALPALRAGVGFVEGLSHACSAVLGLLLVAGLWIPITGVLVALDALLQHDPSHPADLWQWLLLGTDGAALALLGPGAWSVDARLFGWRRIEIPDRKHQSGEPPA
jgi:putative oxidoreductase